MSLVTLLILLPLLGALISACIPRNYRFLIRVIALVVSAITLLLGVTIFLRFNPAAATTIQFEQQIPWVESLGLSFHVGADGINVGLLLMGAIVSFAAVCLSREIRRLEKEFYVLLQVMIGGILGAFASFDIFFFYFFHELALVPTFIMIGVWGKGEDRNYATFKITLYLSLGALISLAGLILLYIHTGAAD
jgi:NADH-quinone oxidoreductase subunit M